MRSVSTGPGLMPKHAHAELRAVAAQRPAERHQRSIGRAAGDIVEIELLAAKADDVHDHAATALLHPRNRPASD